MKPPLAFINGRWAPASQAVVPVTDAGFVLGATVAEQLRTFRGKIFHLDEHLDRLTHSLEIVNLQPTLTRDQLAKTAEEIVHRNHALLTPGDDLGLSIVVTPGIYPTYTSGEETENTAAPTVCLHTYPLPFRLWAEKYRRGQILVTTDIEQVPARCWPTSLKCRSRMHYYLADKRAATIEHAARALLLDAQGYVTETSTANLLIYRKAEGLASPPLHKILHGISLAVARQLAGGLAIPWVERELTVDDVATADEVLLTSTPMCLLPVTRLNGRPIQNGEPGEVFQCLLKAWSEMAGLDIAEQARIFSVRTIAT